MIVQKIYSEYNNQHCGYKMTLDNGHDWIVPLDTANTDYQAIQKWIAEGGVVIDNGGNN